MLKHSEQRVGVFIDVQNLYYSARAIYNMKVNFGEILKASVAGRKLVRAVGYVVRAQVPEEEDFFRALERLGIETKARDLQTFADGTKKGNWDVGMTVDIAKMADKLDAIVLVSGDGDFADILSFAKSRGCRAEVVCFGKSTSKMLRDEADDFIDLDEEHSKYLIVDRRRRESQRRFTAKKPTAAGSPTSSDATKGA